MIKLFIKWYISYKHKQRIKNKLKISFELTKHLSGYYKADFLK